MLTVNARVSDGLTHDGGRSSRSRRTDFGALQEALGADVIDWETVETDPLARGIRNRFGFGPAAAVVAFRRRHTYDVVWCFSEIEGLVLAFLFKLFRIRKGVLIVGIELMSTKAIFFLRRLRVWTHFTALLPTSTYQTEEVIRRARVPRRKLAVLPYQVDSDYFHPVVSGSGSFPGRYIVAAGLESRDYGTLFTAARGLAVDIRIAAASHWAGRQPSWRLSDAPANVEVGSYSYPELRELYQGATLAVVPLHEAPYQHGITALQEAMAMGLPVIVTRTRGQSDVVIDRRRHLRAIPERATRGSFVTMVEPPRPELARANGFYVAPGDAEAMRRSIQYLLDHPDLAREMGQRGQQVAREVLSLDRFVERAVRLVAAAWNGDEITPSLIWSQDPPCRP